jgi:hypothetical protein
MFSASAAHARGVRQRGPRGAAAHEHRDGSIEAPYLIIANAPSKDDNVPAGVIDVLDATDSNRGGTTLGR